MDRRNPDKQGIAGRAWKVATDSVKVANWLLHAPMAHPFWWWYSVTLVTLADVEGCEPAKVFMPGATHELAIIALDPKHEPDPEKAADGYPWLQPLNLAEQFIVLNDEQAIRLTEKMIEAFVAGQLSPDTDFLTANKASVQATAEHLRLGGQHPDGPGHG